MGPKSHADLEAAFDADGYDVRATELYRGCRGILAAARQDPDRTAIYVEGPPFERGVLIGRLAWEKVERMTGEFVDNIVPAFVAPSLFHPLRFRKLKGRLMDILRDRCLRTCYRHPQDIPRALKDEMMGIAAGCKARNPRTTVSYRELFLLNAGIDFLLSYVYTGAHLLDWAAHFRRFVADQRERSALLRRLAAALHIPRVRPGHFRVPFGCNAFVLSSRLTEEGSQYLGRDFMFPTASVFQDTCCLIVSRPSAAEEALATVSLTAPGLVGSVTAINSRGVGIGVDMLPGENCSVRRPGLNSLLMVRWCADHARGFDEAVDLIVAAQRGVSWLYVVAAADRAAAVEAGMRTPVLRGLSYVPERYLPVLGRYPYEAARDGAMVRGSGYVGPPQIAALNERLFAMRGMPHDRRQELPDGMFHTRENEPWKQKAVPRSFYFPPQREQRPDLLIATNQSLTPEMRLCAMGPWVSMVTASSEDDLQWRYDELCREIREALGPDPAAPRRVSLEEAKALIDFLSPLRRFPSYYAHNAISAKGRRIEGAIALCDLSRRVMHAYFGAYDDRWVRLTLPAYC